MKAQRLIRNKATCAVRYRLVQSPEQQEVLRFIESLEQKPLSKRLTIFEPIAQLRRASRKFGRPTLTSHRKDSPFCSDLSAGREDTRVRHNTGDNQ